MCGSAEAKLHIGAYISSSPGAQPYGDFSKLFLDEARNYVVPLGKGKLGWSFCICSAPTSIRRAGIKLDALA
jgi:hypothetical protein